MDCPNRETFQDFIDGELSESSIKQIGDHIRSCDACKGELRQLYTLQGTLNQVIDKDPCPSLDALEKYADNGCSDEQTRHITEHIDFCGRCRSYVWTFRASEAELADWQAREQIAYNEFKAVELGYDAARETLNMLLPDKIELVDKIWNLVLSFVQNLKDQAVECWPSFSPQARLAGVLGFADGLDPQTNAASIIMVTTLYVSQVLSDGDIKPSAQEIEFTIKKVAVKLGAGKELQKRLIETIPPLVLKLK